MANPKVEALRWILSKPLVPLAKKFMGPGVTKNLPQSSIVNTSDDISNMLTNNIYDVIQGLPDLKPRTILPREGLEFARYTDLTKPVKTYQGKSTIPGIINNVRKITGTGRAITPEKALKETLKSANRSDNKLINILSKLDEQTKKQILESIGGIQYTEIPDYALAAYRAVPLTYGAGLGLLGTGAGGAYMLGGRNE
jgi:hypothetical protein